MNYLYDCERKLWFFDRRIQMESNSERVLLGKLLGEVSYPREKRKEVLIDNLINIDIVGNNEIIEIKYSNKLEHAHKMQILYYLYYLKRLGIEKKGFINYTKMRKRKEVELTPEDEKEIERALLRIREVLAMEKPPNIVKRPYCTKCAYFELCFG
ncbi:MAG: CRISPR-associated protein Cas4 [Brevinematia bacterium]